MALIRRADPPPPSDHERKKERTLAGLIDSLDDPNPTARRWSARDLSSFPEASNALVAHLGQEADRSVREVIFTTLIRIGDDTAVYGLVACLRSEDSALRNEAVEAMKQMPDKVAPIMEGLVVDSDPDVRIFAVNVLESLRHPLVEAWLLQIIETDPEVNVCGTAVDLLAEVGTLLAREPIERLLGRFPDEPYIRFASELALNRVGKG